MTKTHRATRLALLGAFSVLALPVMPALALDPVPKTLREKQEHHFRDVQLGLSHPAPHGRSTPNSPAPRTDGANTTAAATNGQGAPARPGTAQ